MMQMIKTISGGIVLSMAVLLLTCITAWSQAEPDSLMKQSSEDSLYIEKRAELLRYMQKFTKKYAGDMKGFYAFAQTAMEPRALDVKTKEMIAIGIAIAERCDDCIAYHTHAALKAGATEKEIMEALGVALYMGGGPSLAYATHVLKAMDQFKAMEEEGD
ncbi:MAG: carboxymuconolactone decarboxylase family protein [Bacteroidales bacterium]|nr:carboxymuconolactone decarboxylase family protein [Bacteroidales bacterium]